MLRCCSLLALLASAWGGAFQEVFRWIESRQLVDPTTCTTRRLLLYHSYGANFEGSASVLKSIMLGLGEAMHSNRTLVWGAYVPPLMARGNASSCYNKAQGGLYACHFRPLSNCDINDLWYGELVDLKMNGFDDSKRASLMHNRRGLAAYIPPPALRNISRIATIWPAALAAFAFRLNAAATARVQELMREVDAAAPMHCAHVRHGDVKSLRTIYQNKATYTFDQYFDVIKSFPGPAPGTVFVATDAVDGAAAVAKAALSWPPRPFPADDDSAADLTDGAADASASAGTSSVAVAVSVDGSAPLLLSPPGNDTTHLNATSSSSKNNSSAPTNADTAVATNSTSAAKKAPAASAPPPQQAASVGVIPHFLHLERARSEYGAHIEATLGGCVGASCSVPEDVFLKLQARQQDRDKREQRELKGQVATGAVQGTGDKKIEGAAAAAAASASAPGAGLSARVERVVREAVEDIAVLSHCACLVGTATSHFSTMGMLLAWARLLDAHDGQGADAASFPIDPKAFVMLDGEEVARGQFESSHLLGTFRNQTLISRKDGPLRYAHLEMRLREKELEVSTPLLRADPRNFGLPTMSHSAFDEISAVWTSPDGNCSEMEGEGFEVVGNYGADHHEWHPGKALACWQLSMDLLHRQASTLRAKGVDVDQVRETLVFNMRTVRDKHFSIWTAYS